MGSLGFQLTAPATRALNPVSPDAPLEPVLAVDSSRLSALRTGGSCHLTWRFRVLITQQGLGFRLGFRVEGPMISVAITHLLVS